MLIRPYDLRKIRHLSALTTHDIANLVGVRTRKTYENWEKGIGGPTANQFHALLIGSGFNPIKVYQALCARYCSDNQTIDWSACFDETEVSA